MALDNNSRGQQAVHVSGAVTGIAVIIVLLRLFTRFHVARCSGVEDYLICLAMLCSIGLTVCVGIQAHHGMGLHTEDLAPQNMQYSLKAFYASLIVYYLSLGLTKSSILLQYHRIFTTRKFRIVCWTIMVLVIAYTIWTVLGSIFACLPIHAFWTKEQPAKCINQMAMWFTNAGINILTDFAIIILPLPVFQSLNLPQRQKQALIGVFAVGLFVCIVSVLRLQSLVAISNSSDPVYDNPPAATWSSVETNVGIICSSLPHLRPLVARHLSSAFQSSLERYDATSGEPPIPGNAYHRRSAKASSIIPLQSRDSDVPISSEDYDSKSLIMAKAHGC